MINENRSLFAVVCTQLCTREQLYNNTLQSSSLFVHECDVSHFSFYLCKNK